eukprot:494218-Alexandrium_andersonii.AAC.1
MYPCQRELDPGSGKASGPESVTSGSFTTGSGAIRCTYSPEFRFGDPTPEEVGRGRRAMLDFANGECQ